VKKQQIKRKNHYIWAHYLKGWSVNNQDVFHRAKKGVVASSVRGLGREIDFYKMSPLETDDIQFLKQWISITDEPIRKFHNSFLEKMIAFSCVYKLLTGDEHQVERDVLVHNTIEDIHSTVEGDVRPIIDALRTGDLSILNDESALNNFHSYIGHQFARTKHSRSAWEAAASSLSVDYRRLMQRNWWFLGVLAGVNVGYSIARYYYRKKIVWLVNDTDVPFLTSDNPVINVHPTVRDKKLSGEPPSNTDFYFPISPKLAYMVNDSDTYGVGIVKADVELVKTLNRNMLMRSSETVFGSSKEIIRNTKV